MVFPIWCDILIIIIRWLWSHLSFLGYFEAICINGLEGESLLLLNLKIPLKWLKLSQPFLISFNSNWWPLNRVPVDKFVFMEHKAVNKWWFNIFELIELFTIVHYTGEAEEVSIFERCLDKRFMFNSILNYHQIKLAPFHFFHHRI